MPEQTLRLIVGFAAGTAPNLVARVLGQKLQETAQFNVVVDNKPGAGGLIAAQEAACAAPDGDVPAVFASVALALPNVKAGKMPALAVSSGSRSSSFPDVPTLKEAGFANLAGAAGRCRLSIDRVGNNRAARRALHA